MAPKQKRLKKEGNKEPAPKTEPKQHPEEDRSSEKGFDFGGLPQRDLKKNLGCG